MNKTAKQLLLDAKAELEKRELSRGCNLRSDVGLALDHDVDPKYVASCCIYGALNLAGCDDDDDSTEYRLARRLILDLIGGYKQTYSGITISSWNDKPERTKQQVLDVLQAAANLAP